MAVLDIFAMVLGGFVGELKGCIVKQYMLVFNEANPLILPQKSLPFFPN